MATLKVVVRKKRELTDFIQCTFVLSTVQEWVILKPITHYGQANHQKWSHEM